MKFQDKTLKCIDCGVDFVFSAGEQTFFHDKQFRNEPKRCKPCKAKRLTLLGMPFAAGENVPYMREQTKVTCLECGRLTTVPFRPTQGRPVFCRECFQRRRDQADITRSHEVQFYSDGASFLEGFTHFIEAVLKAGNPVIVVATESHHNSLLQRLQAYGVDIATACGEGRYIPLDVVETLSTFMVNGRLDQVRFLKVAGDLVAAALRTATGDHPRVAACGEAAPALWAQGNGEVAVQLEHLWDEVARTSPVDIMCGYVLNSFQREQESHIYRSICAEHSVVYSQ